MSIDTPVEELEFDIDDLIEGADAAEDKLTQWERDFMADMAQDRRVRGSIMKVSERQADILRRIWRKVA